MSPAVPLVEWSSCDWGPRRATEPLTKLADSSLSNKNARRQTQLSNCTHLLLHVLVLELSKSGWLSQRSCILYWLRYSSSPRTSPSRAGDQDACGDSSSLSSASGEALASSEAPQGGLLPPGGRRRALDFDHQNTFDLQNIAQTVHPLPGGHRSHGS